MHNVSEALIKGLVSNPKYIPAWFRYDEEGSRLNDRCIERSEHYYFHRCEVQLLKDIVETDQICLDNFDVLVDLGSGNAFKTRLFLNKLVKSTKRKIYVPVDISADYLYRTANQIKKEFGKGLEVEPIAKDYLDAMEEISEKYEGLTKLLVLFGGGILNFSRDERKRHLSGLSRLIGGNDRLLISVDITDPNDKETIENAYHDPNGYCRAFNMNVITRLNNEFEANIDPAQFDVKAKLIKKESKNKNSYVDIWIEAKKALIYRVGKLDLTLRIGKGEKLFLHEDDGISSKFTMDQVQYLLNQSSLSLDKVWSNDHVAVVASHCK